LKNAPVNSKEFNSNSNKIENKNTKNDTNFEDFEAYGNNNNNNEGPYERRGLVENEIENNYNYNYNNNQNQNQIQEKNYFAKIYNDPDTPYHNISLIILTLLCLLVIGVLLGIIFTKR